MSTTAIVIILLLAVPAFLATAITYFIMYVRKAGQPAEHHTDLRKHYSPFMGWLAAFFQSKKSEARTNLAGQINLETEAVTASVNKDTELVDADTRKQTADFNQDV